jgi:hypothetical protein
MGCAENLPASTACGKTALLSALALSLPARKSYRWSKFSGRHLNDDFSLLEIDERYRENYEQGPTKIDLFFFSIEHGRFHRNAGLVDTARPG